METDFTGYSCISNLGAKDILSSYFGETKRIPLSCVNLTRVDGLVTQIDAQWKISENDVKDHIGGILQGVMIQEAASQAIICYVAAMDLFPDHSPAFLGSDHFRLHMPVRAGENLHIRITGINWRGKKGSASVEVFRNREKVATIGNMLFRANSNKIARRFVIAA